MKKIVILISGKIKSGKNEAANILKQYFEEKGLTVTHDYFAKALKEYCRDDFKILADVLNEFVDDLIDLFDLDAWRENYVDDLMNKVNQLKISEDNWFEDKTFITRAILQVVGTQIMRMRVNDNYWVNLMKDKCEKSQSDIICVSDARFINEIEGMYSDKYDVITVRLMRDINKGKSKHESETALDDYDCFNYVIDNKRNTLKSFEKQIKSVGEEILNNMKEETEINYSNNILEPHIYIENMFKNI